MYEVYIAGATAAFTVDCLIYPLDTLKTRYQSQDFVQTYASSRPLKNKPLFRGLYQGIGSVILSTLPAAGIFFATYESMKRTVSVAIPGAPQPLVHSLASGTAEMASCIVLAPAEVIKQNAQMLSHQISGSRSQRSTSLAALQHVTSSGATKRLFTGYSALVARNLPFTAIQFPIFEYIRQRMVGHQDRTPAGQEKGLAKVALVNGLSAASAGAFAALVTTPSDVVKTRLMLRAGERQGVHTAGSRTTPPVKGSLAVARAIYQTTGIRGLFRGGLFRSVWTALGSGLYLGTYEMSKVWLSRGTGGLDEFPLES